MIFAWDLEEDLSTFWLPYGERLVMIDHENMICKTDVVDEVKRDGYKLGIE